MGLTKSVSCKHTLTITKTPTHRNRSVPLTACDAGSLITLASNEPNQKELRKKTPVKNEIWNTRRSLLASRRPVPSGFCLDSKQAPHEYYVLNLSSVQSISSLSSLETSLYLYQTTLRHIPEDSIVCCYRRENLVCHR
jgi:hypothetical protein